MPGSWLLGLDWGGGSVRCLLLDAETGRTVVSSRPCRPHVPSGLPTGSELDLAAGERLLAAAVREALARAEVAPREVAAVAATSLRHASVLVDAAGEARLACSNRDARGLAEAASLAERHGDALLRLSGRWPSPIHPAARLLWLEAHAPSLWKDAVEGSLTHLALGDWLALRLCGESASEPTQAAETLLWDLAAGAWSTEWSERLGLPPSLLPPVRRAGERLGELSGRAAEALGLPAGLAVGVGAADTQSGLLGAGVLTPGRAAVIAGTTAPVQRVLAEPRVDGSGRLWTSPHAAPGRFVLESNAGGVGDALAWMAELLYPEAAFPVARLLDEAARSEPGAAGLHSTFGAELMNGHELALPLGSLTLTPLAAADDPERRRHLARAVVEGVVYGLRGNLEQLEERGGPEAPPLRLSGGLARSASFAQLLCDVLARPVEVTAVPEATALGAALCAGVAGGLHADLDAAAERHVALARTHEPDPARAAAYAELYPAWRGLREQRRACDEAAAGVALRGLLAGGGPAAEAPDAGERPRILVSADMDEDGLDALRAIGEVEYQSFRQAMRLLTGESLVEALTGVQVFVTEVDVVDAAALVRARDLRLIAVCRGDAVNVDLEACTALGIPVLHTPGRNADAVADLTLAFLLMLARKLPAASAFLREPGGEPGDMGRMGRAYGLLQGRELWRKQVGLIGLGAVGRKVVERLRPFGARCLAHDPFLSDDAVRAAGAEPCSLDELLRRSDFVSLHAAVTDATRGLIGRRELARMREGAALVNTARAALVDEDALVEALASGALGGAALDVFAVEPPGSDHPLLALPNVIATPHVGGNTADVAAHQGRIVAEELGRLRRGERPRHVLNPETLSTFSWTEPRPEPGPELVERLGRSAGPAVTDLQKGRPESAEGSGRTRPARPRAGADTGPTAPTAPTARKEAGAVDDEIRQAMERLVRTFLERLEADAALVRFAAGKDVTLHFTLSDLGLAFHLGFHDGRVTSGMGAPPGQAAVQLKMKADLLDGMFTGRRNAMQAAMNGELSFSGDTAKAMTLQHINDDLSRLYREVREELGDPGDLGSLPDPSGAPAAAAPAGERDVRREIVEVVNELYVSQLITATGGNVSARVPDRPDEAWITPSQLFKGDLEPEILVRIDMDGRALEEGARSPSSEALMHTAVLEARPEAQAVIHAHAPHATILANTGLPFLPISTEAAFFVNIGRIPFIMPGTRDLADAIVEAMGDGWAVLMQNHGLLVAGRSLRRAADMVEIIDRTAQVILGCYAVGKEPPVLPEETVKMLSQYADLMA